MSLDDNTVNIEKRAYHHGDLRAALIAEGLRLLSARAQDDFSLREVARNVGVSATSVYRHFPDKEALMAALAEEGLERLAEAQSAAAAAAGGGEAGFAATGREYVRFALANPALFRLIFTSPRLERWTSPSHESPTAMSCLRDNAAAVAGADPDSPEARRVALHAWSLVHGLAMLMLDGQIPADEALMDGIVGPPNKEKRPGPDTGAPP